MNFILPCSDQWSGGKDESDNHSQDKKARWSEHLPEMLFAYNGTRSRVTGYSPYFLLFGRKARMPVDYLFPTLHDSPHQTKMEVSVAAMQKRLKRMTVIPGQQAQAKVTPTISNVTLEASVDGDGSFEPLSSLVTQQEGYTTSRVWLNGKFHTQALDTNYVQGS